MIAGATGPTWSSCRAGASTSRRATCRTCPSRSAAQRPQRTLGCRRRRSLFATPFRQRRRYNPRLRSAPTISRASAQMCILRGRKSSWTSGFVITGALTLCATMSFTCLGGFKVPSSSNSTSKSGADGTRLFALENTHVSMKLKASYGIFVPSTPTATTSRSISRPR